uniref:hypothetical protein n=1 Tax=Pseudomonas asplenii TaxID=53407 RepID=UPI0012FA4764
LERDVNTKIIGDLIIHDDRINSTIEFFDHFSRLCIEKKWNNGSDLYQYATANNYRKNAQERLKYATMLHDILTKIENIKGIVPQLRAAGEIDESLVKLGDGFVKSPLSIIRINSNPHAIAIGNENHDTGPDS